ncbi:hypothetical protein MB901379_02010 [Mycobacterium basiliense]|uniref:Uncharacterized protein n=1 Tax=Mycobacterium basiliense TaxID=2094119 RepID=A0A3S4BVC2_9MYCO|nr:hypothetical protein [Mycobacterium basiliense]VDM88448.1 hypothetical protein MB901379_02010 [Mycobacterium basiliense]
MPIPRPTGQVETILMTGANAWPDIDEDAVFAQAARIKATSAVLTAQKAACDELLAGLGLTWWGEAAEAAMANLEAIVRELDGVLTDLAAAEECYDDLAEEVDELKGAITYRVELAQATINMLKTQPEGAADIPEIVEAVSALNVAAVSALAAAIQEEGGVLCEDLVGPTVHAE